MTITPVRRRFLTRGSALGTASLFGMPGLAQPEPHPETTKLRIGQGPFICYVPQLNQVPQNIRMHLTGYRGLRPLALVGDAGVMRHSIARDSLSLIAAIGQERFSNLIIPFATEQTLQIGL